MDTYFADGPGEQIDAAKYDWDWNSAGAEGKAWVAAASPMRGAIGAGGSEAHSADTTAENAWDLVADALPRMESTATSAGEIVRAWTTLQRSSPD